MAASFFYTNVEINHATMYALIHTLQLYYKTWEEYECLHSRTDLT